MNIYILREVNQLTERYHSLGGLVIVAKSKTHAKEVISTDQNIQPTEEEWKDTIIYKISDEAEPRYFVFPDAGSC